MIFESDFAFTGDAVTTPAPPTYEERATAALSNAVIPQRSGVDKEFTGVDRPLTGVYDNTFFCT